MEKELTIEITSRCQLNCEWCSTKRETDIDLPLEKIVEILIKGKEDHFTHVRFTGGEPTLYKDLAMCIYYAKKLGYHITLLTNGIIKYFEPHIDKFEVQWSEDARDTITWLKYKKQANVSINIVNVFGSHMERCIGYSIINDVPVHIMKLQHSGNATKNELKEINISMTHDHSCNRENKRLYLPTGQKLKCAADKSIKGCKYK